MSNIGTHPKQGPYYVIQERKLPGERVTLNRESYYCKSLTYARWVARMGGNGSTIVRPDASGNSGTVVARVVGPGKFTNVFYAGTIASPGPPVHGSKGQRIKR